MNANLIWIIIFDCGEDGEKVTTENGLKICKFAGSSCPANYTPYQNYTTTVSATCGGETASYTERVCPFGIGCRDVTRTCSGGRTCTTSSHSFSATPIESCSASDASVRSGVGFDANSRYCSTSLRICPARVTEIGCY